MCGGCLSVAYTLTGVRGNDDDVDDLESWCRLQIIDTVWPVVRPCCFATNLLK